MSNNAPTTEPRRGHRKLSPEDEKEVLRLDAAGIKAEVLAVQFGVHFNTIGNIRRRAGLPARKRGSAVDAAESPQGTPVPNANDTARRGASAANAHTSHA